MRSHKGPATLAVLAAALVAAPAAEAGERYVVVYRDGASLTAAHAAVRAAGGRIVRENRKVGVATVRARAGFLRRAARQRALLGASRNRSIGSVPGAKPRREQVESNKGVRAGKAPSSQLASPPPGGEPLSGWQWDMAMMDATPTGSYASQPGTHGVRVGVIDTGIQGDHPDIAPNFNAGLSRNFTTDIPLVDGECADDPDGSCEDPADVDENSHGTHVAGTIASPLNAIGIGGVAPGIELVNLRAGQDSGYFFLEETVNALTYAGDHGIDVVNMSFYIDPWLYNCAANPADTPAQQAEQRAIIAGAQRALDYARGKGVTLVGASGNESTDLGHPSFDDTSPDYPPDSAHERNVDNTCLDMPTEGEGVLSINSVGPSGRKAYYSNYGLEQSTVAAPGGDRREFFGTPLFNAPQNRILAPFPNAEVGQGQDSNQDDVPDIDEDGNPTIPTIIREPADGETYWQWIQGTSMASPHAVGVAALIVSEFGTADPVNGGLTMAPAEVEKVLRATAADVACPEPRLFHYPDDDLNGTLDATCEGDSAFNGFYGDGIVNALAAVSYAPPAPPAPAPSPVFKPRVRPGKVSTSLRARRRGRGLTLRVSGTLTPPEGVAAAEACKGALTVVVSSSGRTTLASRVAQLRGDCSYTKTIRFARRSRLSRTLRVRVTFYGNDALLPRQAALRKPRVPGR